MTRSEGFGAPGRRLVMFGSYDATLHPRVAVLADGLAGHGWVVEEINAPWGVSTADKVASTSSPAAAVRMAGRALSSWRTLISERFGAGHPDVVVVGYLGHADIHLARALFPRSVLVLDHLVGLADTLGDRGLGGGRTVAAVGRVDRAALRAAAVVVVDTALQRGVLPAWAQPRAVVVPVGAQATWARAADAAQAAGPRRKGDPLRVVFFGLYTPLQGTVTIARAIAALRDAPVRFTMVGDGQQRAEAEAAAGNSPNVSWIDWVDSRALPGLVAGSDVCLGVFGTGEKAARVVPTKVYQGIAAGCAVITAATPASEAVRDSVLTVPAGDPAALATLLRTLADDEDLLAAARDRARAGARQFTPTAVTEPLDEALTAAVGLRRRDTPPPLTMNAWFRWDLIEPQLERSGARDILEIGPGEGAVACRLAADRSYTGVELSARTRQVTADRLAAQGTPGHLVSSLDELPPDARFDIVCAFEVIEHIEDDDGALRAWAARIRPGGQLILSTPADPQRFGAHDTLAGHYRRYRPEALAEQVRDAGLVDVRVEHTGHPIGYALEGIRHRLASRRLAAAGVEPGTPVDPHRVAAHTEQSSSLLQPPGWSGTLTRIASAPGRWAQRRRPDRGTGLVLFARAPD